TYCLASILILLLVALPISRRYLLSGVLPVPPPNAEPAAFARYYESRIKADPRDAAAQLQLGLLEERNGQIMAALDRLATARSLKAPDAETAGPIGRCLLRAAHYEGSKR